MIEFRILTPETLESALPLAREFADAIDSPVVRLVEPEFLKNWQTYVGLGVGIALAAFDGEAPAGALFGYLAPDHLNGALVAEEAWWFVSPAYRGAGVGRALVELYERVARERGARRISLGALGHLAPVDKLLTDLGYRPFETHYFKFLS